MPRDNRDLDNASSSGQSKRPPLDHRDSDSQSDTTNNTSGAPSHQHRTKTHQTHQKHHHHVGRLNARVPSTKAFHKQHAHTGAHGQPPKLIRRQTSRPASPTEVERPPHRRATSEVKLARQSSSANLPKSLSPTSLKRNRSHVEVGKRTRSSDKLKRTSSGTGIHRHTPKTCNNNSKTQVHFDFGSDDQEDDEWVDASGSNSPYLSRKGSLTNGSAQSSLRHEPSTGDPQPTTPGAASQTQQQQSASPASPPSPPSPPSPADKETSQHKEYITSRLLQRTPSHGAPPQMTVDLAEGAPAQLARSVSSTHRTVTNPLTGSNPDELVSRFVDTPGSGLTSHGSFYQPNHSTSQRSDELPRRPKSMADLDQSLKRSSEPKTRAPSEVDTSALVPKPGRRTAAPLAETSRTQQKLNLQRASSVLEPDQGLSGGGRAVGASPLIGVGGPGYDGGNSRDHRISKLLERTGMEYLVVRRYQNPAARSLDRLSRLPGMDKTRRVPRTHTRAVNGKHGHAVVDANANANALHMRNVSMPDPRPTTARKTGGGSIRSNGAGSSFQGDDVSRLDERLSGASSVAADEEDGTNALLRNLWEKSMDLSASN